VRSRTPRTNTQDQLSGALGRLLAVSEEYPDFRAPGGRCRASCSPHRLTAATKPSPGRPSLIAEISVEMALAQVSDLILDVDSAVGNNLGIALGDRRENQHARTLLGAVPGGRGQGPPR
jgi:hypothetical protein